MATPRPHDVLYVRDAAELRRWLAENHATAAEVWLGVRHRGLDPGRPAWVDLVDELLCFGWIDSVSHGVPDGRAIRATPRRPDSLWSVRNLARMAELRAAGRVDPAGEAVWAGRRRFPGQDAEGHWSLDDDAAAELRREPAAWEFLQRQPASFREQLAYWIMSARRPQTRQRRLAEARASLARGRRPPPLGGEPAAEASGG